MAALRNGNLIFYGGAWVCGMRESGVSAFDDHSRQLVMR
jgi:hypothetical protein